MAALEAIAQVNERKAGKLYAELDRSEYWRPHASVDSRSRMNVTFRLPSGPVLGFGQSNVRYYVYALLFVMFDVEAVFIFPWAIHLEALGVAALISMIVFILLLALGLVYAWRKGVLRWA